MRLAGWHAASLAAVMVTLAACGGSPAPRFTADPQHYLLALNQLLSPDFTVDQRAAPVSAATLGGGDSKAVLQLDTAGFAAAANVSFARDVDFPTSNGPVEVIDTVARFNGNGGAHAWFTFDAKARDAEQGEVPASVGPLGDEAHADSIIATAPDGIQAVQVTLEWRVANVVVVLQARGRYGGTRLDDALTLAHAQTSVQLR